MSKIPTWKVTGCLDCPARKRNKDDEIFCHYGSDISETTDGFPEDCHIKNGGGLHLVIEESK